MRVLVIEDDASVAAGIIDGLTGSSFDSLLVGTGDSAVAAMSRFDPDIVLLDLGLPDMDGNDLCRLIRADYATPIIVVSARDDEIDRVVALEMGADDYLVKPFGMRELIARIRAVARRTQGAGASPVGTRPGGATEANGRSFGSLTIDLRAQRVTLAGDEIHLTPTEFDLLVHLSSDAGAVYKRADILRDVWQTTWYGTTKTLDAHIAAIRRKLGDPGWIESVRGVGFRFRVHS
jgi:DNA-binding response OmpR family regulator